MRVVLEQWLYQVGKQVVIMRFLCENKRVQRLLDSLMDSNHVQLMVVWHLVMRIKLMDIIPVHSDLEIHPEDMPI